MYTDLRRALLLPLQHLLQRLLTHRGLCRELFLLLLLLLLHMLLRLLLMLPPSNSQQQVKAP